jgi:hypothetical protein
MTHSLGYVRADESPGQQCNYCTEDNEGDIIIATLTEVCSENEN